MTAPHLDEGVVQQLLHDELPAESARAVRAHVDACTECREQLTAACRTESELFNRLTDLDAAIPTLTFHQIVVDDATKRSWRRVPGAWRWAAGILLVVVASGVAYAAPGSPLRLLVTRVRDWVRAPDRVSLRDSTTSVASDPRGVLLDPGERMLIDLRTLQPSDTLRVRLGDDVQIAVRAVGGSVTFASDPDRLAISNSSGVSTIDVQIPRRAPRVEIVSGGRQLYLKVGSTIRSTATDTTGGLHLILPAPR